MLRRIIHIDEEKCNGCGACAAACHEGAIAMVNNRARLMRDDYCDGLGDCLPTCPTGAISFVEREALPYNEAAVLSARTAARGGATHGCPGSQARLRMPDAVTAEGAACPSQLANWPVQIKLAPVQAPYYDGAKLLIAADCTAFAFADFHAQLLAGKIALIACPKLDTVDYAEKLSLIFSSNRISSITVARMEVPCCGELERAVRRAIEASGRELPLEVVTISIDGKVIA